MIQNMSIPFYDAFKMKQVIYLYATHIIKTQYSGFKKKNIGFPILMIRKCFTSQYSIIFYTHDW